MAGAARVHLTGASCTGVSTLGAALAARLGVPHLDVDDFYWMPTDPPFRVKRPATDRVRLIADRQAGSGGWVLAGSLGAWGNALLADASLIVFLEAPTDVRLRRLDGREALRHGARILPGGDMRDAHLAFRDWASRYDDPGFAGRSRARHERWLADQRLPLLRLTGTDPVGALLERVLVRLHGLGEHG